VRRDGTIDLDEIAMPEILDPRQVKGLHCRLGSWNAQGAPLASSMAIQTFSAMGSHPPLCSLSVRGSIRLRSA
jgi:hypothetical protein